MDKDIEETIDFLNKRNQKLIEIEKLLDTAKERVVGENYTDTLRRILGLPVLKDKGY